MADDGLEGDVVRSVRHVIVDAVERLETVVGEAEGPL